MIRVSDQEALAVEVIELKARNDRLLRDNNMLFDQVQRIPQLERDLAEAVKGRLLVPLIHVERDICRMSTRVSLDLPYNDFDECRDRQEFRRRLQAKLNEMGDAFMAAWDERHQQPK